MRENKKDKGKDNDVEKKVKRKNIKKRKIK